MSERQDTLSASDQTQSLRTSDQTHSASSGLLALGSLAGAILASSCCLVPLALFGVGVGGAWIGTLTALAPYQPIFIVATLGCLGAGYWMAYRRSKPVGDGAAVCIQPRPRHLVRIALWSSTVLIIAAAAFPYVGPYLLGV